MDERVLMVMRHAKSAWGAGVTDHRRPLDARGRKDAPRMARELSRRGWLPDHVLVSDAERTRETLAWMEDTLARPFSHDISPMLYLAGLGDLVEAVRDADDDVGVLMLLGHNPGCEEIVAHLSGREITLTTANVVRLVAPSSMTWAEAANRPGAFTVDAVLRPREIEGP